MPPATDSVNAFDAKGAATVPSGSGVGLSTTDGADQPLGLPASPQTARVAPQAVTVPAVPPKATPPLVAVTKSFTALVPEVTAVGNAKSQNLKPVIAVPLESLPLAVVVEMYASGNT